jgi:hypothetical protein
MSGMLKKHDHKWEAYVVSGTLLSGSAMLVLLWMLLKDWARFVVR